MPETSLKHFELLTAEVGPSLVPDGSPAPWMNGRPGVTQLGLLGMQAQIWLDENLYGREIFTKVSMKNRGVLKTPHPFLEFSKAHNSPQIAGPLHQADCAERTVQTIDLQFGPGGTPLIIAFQQGDPLIQQWEKPIMEMSDWPVAREAFEQLKTPKTLEAYSLLMVDDRVASLELLLLEALGFASKGQSGAMLLTGCFSNQRPPSVNPDGGCLGLGYPGDQLFHRMIANTFLRLKTGETGLCCALSEDLSSAQVALVGPKI